MNAKIRAEEADRYIRSIPIDQWEAQKGFVEQELLGWVNAGACTEAEAEMIHAAIEARHERHLKAAKDRLEAMDLRARAAKLAPASPPPPKLAWARPVVNLGAAILRNVARRGPSRFTPAERAKRFGERTYQAHMTGAGAGELRGLTWTVCAVLSIILFDCRETAAAACERRIENIAGAAAVSERSVQYALPILVERGLITVQERPGTTHRITIASVEIEAWGKRAEVFRHHLIEREKIQEKEEDREAPPWGANDSSPQVPEPFSNTPERPDPVQAPEAVPEAVAGPVTPDHSTEPSEAPRTASRRWKRPVEPDPSPESIKPGEGPCDSFFDAILQRLRLPPRGESTT